MTFSDFVYFLGFYLYESDIQTKDVTSAVVLDGARHVEVFSCNIASLVSAGINLDGTSRTAQAAHRLRLSPVDRALPLKQ